MLNFHNLRKRRPEQETVQNALENEHAFWCFHNCQNYVQHTKHEKGTKESKGLRTTERTKYKPFC